MVRHRRLISLVLLILSMAAFVICMPMDSFCVSGTCSGWPSWSVLLLGWLETFDILHVGPFVALCWYANVYLFLSWAAVSMRSRLALVFSALAVALSVSFLLGRDVVSNEGGVALPITGVAAGYWLWVASASLSVLSSLSGEHGRAVRSA